MQNIRDSPQYFHVPLITLLSLFHSPYLYISNLFDIYPISTKMVLPFCTILSQEEPFPSFSYSNMNSGSSQTHRSAIWYGYNLFSMLQPDSKKIVNAKHKVNSINLDDKRFNKSTPFVDLSKTIILVWMRNIIIYVVCSI